MRGLRLHRYVLTLFTQRFIAIFFIKIGVLILLLFLKFQDIPPNLIYPNFFWVLKLLAVESIPYSLLFASLIGTIITFSLMKNQQELRLIDLFGQRGRVVYFPLILVTPLIIGLVAFFLFYYIPQGRKQFEKIELDSLKNPAAVAFALALKPEVAEGFWVFFDRLLKDRYLGVSLVRISSKGEVMLTQSQELKLEVKSPQGQKVKMAGDIGLNDSFLELKFKEIRLIQMDPERKMIQGPIERSADQMKIPLKYLNRKCPAEKCPSISLASSTLSELAANYRKLKDPETIRSIQKEILRRLMLTLSPLFFILLGLSVAFLSTNYNYTVQILIGTAIFWGYLLGANMVIQAVILPVSIALLIFMAGLVIGISAWFLRQGGRD